MTARSLPLPLLGKKKESFFTKRPKNGKRKAPHKKRRTPEPLWKSVGGQAGGSVTPFLHLNLIITKRRTLCKGKIISLQKNQILINEKVKIFFAPSEEQRQKERKETAKERRPQEKEDAGAAVEVSQGNNRRFGDAFPSPQFDYNKMPDILQGEKDNLNRPFL